MTQAFGIDTSIVVRLVTGQPVEIFERCSQRLQELVVEKGAEVFASNQVIGEAYVSLQHHYGVSKLEARRSLAKLLRSGLVAALEGDEVLAILEEARGAGLIDQLIALSYRRSRLVTLTLDQKMAKLSGARLLS
jgi:predicted nucleic acid-binding protein